MANNSSTRNHLKIWKPVLLRLTTNGIALCENRRPQKHTLTRASKIEIFKVSLSILYAMPFEISIVPQNRTIFFLFPRDELVVLLISKIILIS